MRIFQSRALAAAFLCAPGILIAGTADATTTFDTTYAWDGSSYIAPFGYVNSSTFGQTFVAPSNVIDDFTFYLNGVLTLQFQAQIYGWTGGLRGGGGGRATGPALYTSAPITLGPSPSTAFVPVTISTGGVSIVPGSAYVALFTISGPDPSNFTNSSSTQTGDRWGVLSTHSLFPDGAVHVPGDGGGGFVFYNNGSNYAALNSTTWDNSADFGDSAWTAHFSGTLNPPPPPPPPNGVPEPSTLALLAAALGILTASRRPRKTA